MGTTGKFSNDSVTLFASRISSHNAQHIDIRRSRSHGSSPIAGRMQTNLRTTSKDNELNEMRDARQVLQSPMFARSLRYLSKNNENNESMSMPNSSDETKEWQMSKFETDSVSHGDKNSKKKSSLVKNLFVKRLRSGSWHATSDLDTSTNQNDLDRMMTSNGTNPEEKRKDTTEIRKEQLEVNSFTNELTAIIRQILNAHLDNEPYDYSQASLKCSMLSKIIETAVKSKLNVAGKNFKISTLVFLGEVKDDGIKMATQCAWEPSQDHFAMATYESEELFASAMVFAVGFDDGYDAECIL